LVEVQFKDTINQDILGMMNTKYIIMRDEQTPRLTAVLNPSACGHAWFVDNVKFVLNADQEIEAITNFSPKAEAIVHQEFRELISNVPLTKRQPKDRIDLVSYSPDHMIYQSNTQSANLAVFSEIYYNKGWKMLIDGVEKPYFRANYVLRAAKIPAGNHKVEFIFNPDSYYTGEKISLAGSFLLVLLLAGAAFVRFRKFD
ncbi:YfhO family protein, partial [Pedobacter sp.]|uniref:YfhO family protein n=1 Tax=Pedobacter sp. TaxID=1411316 RepID=UPI003D7FAC58